MLMNEQVVQVWCRETVVSSPDVVALAESRLSPKERARAARFVRTQDRCDYVVAHALLRETLSPYVGVPPAALQFEVDATGKPHLASHYASPLAFSLSHTRRMAACALGVACDVGVDVESHDHSADDAIAELALSASERQALADLPETEKSKRLLALWTLKEAYFKATGEGLGGPLDRVAFAIAPDGAAQLTSLPLTSGSWRFALFAPGVGHTLAVACRDSAPDADRAIWLHPLT